jgi:hypothetical protein
MERFHFINNIIYKYNLQNPKYLEVGVWYGGTFKHINTNFKDGVDPAQYCECEYVNYRMTSDEFFKNHIKQKYDIVFIDGLHTAHQVSKDIYNSINNLNDGGWIVLDDVFPHAEEEQKSINLKNLGKPLTGDVWKAVYDCLDDLLLMSDIVLFEPNTERGNMAFKIKSNNNKNITIDDTIPTCNVDGWYDGDDAEWNKYDFNKDFTTYFNRISKFPRI